MILPSSAQTGAYFVKKNEVYVSHSNWVISTTIPLDMFLNHFDKMTRQMLGLNETLQTLENSENSDPEVRRFIREMSALFLKEMQLSYGEFKMVRKQFDELTSLSRPSSASRITRSLLPFVGSALSQLFGVVSEDQMRQVRNRLQTLKTNQDRIIHVVDESLTMIKETRALVSENREAIRRLNVASNELNEKTLSLTRQIAHIDNQIYFIEVSIAMQELFVIVRQLLAELSLTVHDLHHHVNDALHGKLSTTLISPSQLKETLIAIKRKLPKSVTMPFPLNKNGLHDFYSFVPTTLMLVDNEIHVLLLVPITRDEPPLSIFQIVTVPVFHQNRKATAEFHTETSFIAISQDKRYFAMLDTVTDQTCLSNKYCKLTAIMYSVRTYPSCAVSLLLENKNAIRTQCRKIMNKSPPVPVIRFLSVGNWILSTPIDLIADVTCSPDSQPHQRSYSKGISLVKIEKGCTMRTVYFQIHAGLHEETLVVDQEYFNSNFHFNQTEYSIWQDLDIDFPEFHNLTNLSKALKPIEDLPLENLHEVLHESLESNRVAFSSDNDDGLSWWMIMILTVAGTLTIIIVIIVVLAIKFQICKGRMAYGMTGGQTGLDEPRESARPEEIPMHILRGTKRRSSTTIAENPKRQHVSLDNDNDDNEPGTSTDVECHREPLEVTPMNTETLEHQGTSTKGLVARLW